MRLVRLSAAFAAAVLLLVLVTATIAVAQPASTSRRGTATTYHVWVGAENAHRGVGIMAFFPSTTRIHVGDTVRWLQNSNEIHTVTFLGGQPLPDFVAKAASLGLPTTPSPLVFNPLATDRTPSPVTIGDQTTWANSGVMGTEQGQFRSFTVTFTAVGTYHYVCLVHGKMMMGTIEVVGNGTRVPSPMQDWARAQFQIAHQMAKVPAVFKAARQAIQPPTQNQDGSWTHHVLLGFAQGQIDLMRFFPSHTVVRPGDTVEWTMGPASDAPHTISFLNGTTEPNLVIPVPQQTGPPVFYVNPDVLFPAQPAQTLQRTGYYNSGLLLPIPGTTYSLTVGDVSAGPLRYLCQLHDRSGMHGMLVVLPK